MSAHDEKPPAYLDVKCPICDAGVDQQCQGEDISPGGVHASRIERALFERSRETDAEVPGQAG